MNRRQFVKMTSAVAIAATDLSAQEKTSRRPLPRSQQRPLPELGSHWDVFEGISSRCKPKLSFLNEPFDDPKAWTQQARAALSGHLHYDPPCVDPKPERIDRVDRGTHTRERIMISTTPDIRIPVYLLVPKGLSKPAPAIVALHDHGGFYFWGKEKLVHVDPEHPELTAFKKKYYAGRSIADELAKRGYVVIVSDMMHWGERAMVLDADPRRIKNRTADVDHQDILDFNARSWAHEELVSRTALACGATWSGMIVTDDLRITDYLLTRPEVDPNRVGCVGLSLGSVRSIYLGALHPAVRAAVAVCWLSAYQPMTRAHIRNGIGFTKLVPGLYNDLDWPDVGGLHWPGALMTICGLQDQLFPIDAVKEAADKLRRIFSKAGSPKNYENIFFEGPHEFNLAMQQRAFDWLSHQMGIS